VVCACRVAEWLSYVAWMPRWHLEPEISWQERGPLSQGRVPVTAAVCCCCAIVHLLRATSSLPLLSCSLLLIEPAGFSVLGELLWGESASRIIHRISELEAGLPFI
jgi:hypothetical protein